MNKKWLLTMMIPLMIAGCASEGQAGEKGDKGDPDASELNSNDGVTTFIVTDDSKEWTLFDEPISIARTSTTSEYYSCDIGYRWHDDKLQFLTSQYIELYCSCSSWHLSHPKLIVPVFMITYITPDSGERQNMLVQPTRKLTFNGDFSKFDAACSSEHVCQWRFDDIFTYRYYTNNPGSYDYTTCALSREETLDGVFFSERFVEHHPMYNIWKNQSSQHFSADAA